MGGWGGIASSTRSGQSLCAAVCLSLFLSDCVFVYFFLCLSSFCVCLSLSVLLSLCLSVSVCLSLSVSVRLSVSLTGLMSM